jgi:formamidopyrimidine-DNA glycosylase
MPELPDLSVYTERLAALALGSRLERLRVRSPFLLRTAVPPAGEAEGRRLQAVERLGKRIVLVFEGELFLALHLMVGGRLLWRPTGSRLPGRIVQAVFEFESGMLVFTEAGTRRRASLHVVAGRGALAALDPGGLEVPGSRLRDFAQRLRAGNHTLKRALTDPKCLAGIGNAYSDEILHRARLSPVRLTRSLDDAEIETLHGAAQAVLAEWTARLRAEAPVWPDKVTAFRPGMAVHGRFGQPCPDCGAPVQRIVHADNETNYCARCQNGGRLLADRALSRLLKADWPRSIDELG